MHIKKGQFLVALAILFVIGLYGISLRIEVQEQRLRTEARNVNQAFIDGFFSYRNTAERYKKTPELMTSQGFKTTHPSGERIPEKGADIFASISDLKSYEYAQGPHDVEYISVFTQTIQYNGKESSEDVIIRTKLVFIKGEGWKVDDLENLSTGRQS